MRPPSGFNVEQAGALGESFKLGWLWGRQYERDGGLPPGRMGQFLRGSPMDPEEGVPFYWERWNRDEGASGTFIATTGVQSTLATFTAPSARYVRIRALAFIPDQLTALTDLQITLKVQDNPYQDFILRYGSIGYWGAPELYTITLEPSSTLKFCAAIYNTYRPLGASDYRVETCAQLWGVYLRGR